MAKKYLPQSKGEWFAWGAGIGAVTALILENVVFDSEANFSDELMARIGHSVVGQPFNIEEPGAPLDGIRAQILKKPNPGSYAAALYNGLENVGAKDPTAPTGKQRAAIICSTFIIAGGRISPEGAVAWKEALAQEQQDNEAASEAGYKAVADNCEAGVQAMLTKQPETLSVPVAEQ